jgi:hypothetical protein
MRVIRLLSLTFATALLAPTAAAQYRPGGPTKPDNPAPGAARKGAAKPRPAEPRAAAKPGGAEARLKGVEDRLGAFDQRIAEAERRLDEIGRRLEAVAAATARKAARSPAEVERREALRKELEARRESLGKLKVSIEKGELDRTVLAPSVAKLESEIKKLEVELSALESAPKEGLEETVARLSREVDELKKQAAKPAASATAAPAAATAVPAEGPVKGLLARLSPTLARVLDLYGTLRLDYAFDSNRTQGGGNWVFWVLRDFEGKIGARDINDQAGLVNSFHARNTRFGFKIDAGRIALIRATLKGQLELDFFGAEAETGTWKAIPRIRIGAVTLDWGLVELMAGNHWDTFSTLIPTIIDSGTLWWGGNLGARRPQIRVTVKPKLGGWGRFVASFALARPFDISAPDYDNLGATKDKNADGKITAKDEYGRVTGEVLTPGNGNNDGSESGMPQLQWRVALETTPKTGTPLVAALGGHFERAVATLPAGTLQKTSWVGWSVGAELVVPIGGRFALRGEAYVGENLKDVMGGVSQDINPQTGEEIMAAGFWAEAVGKILPIWTVAAGYAGDYPIFSTMKIATVAQLEALRFRNQTAYFTTQLDLGSGLFAALSYYHMMTDFRISKSASTLDDGYEAFTAQNDRFMAAIWYSF